MERSTLYAYGLILMTSILILVMILFAQPLGNYVKGGLEGVGNAVVEIGDNVSSNEVEQDINDMFETDKDEIHIDIDWWRLIWQYKSCLNQ